MIEKIVGDAIQMRNLGALIAKQLVDGDVVVLTGPLGAGKTTFSQGVGLGLGIDDAITSPTFVVARTHSPGSGHLGLMHVDAYRLNSADDLVDLDIDSDSPHITLIEWGGGFVEKVTDSWLDVTIDRSSLDNEEEPEAGERRVTFAMNGPKWLSRTLEVTL
jgi:tRNA threonylcarbamoyladenosine biosynthesis protein TsaE